MPISSVRIGRSGNRLRAYATRSWLARRSSLSPIAAPGFSDEPPPNNV
jgi:hypothetical protein